MLPPPPRSTLFPYTTLFRSQHERGREPSSRVSIKVLGCGEPGFSAAIFICQLEDHAMRTMMNAVIAGSALMAAQVWAAPYNLDADQSAVTGIDVQVSTGTTTVTNDPSPLPVDGSWTFDFDGSDQVAFTGVINMNRLAPYDSVTAVDTPLGNMEGTISYEGASHSISGVASWDAATRTLTHELPSGGPNSSIGSSYTETASSCQGEGNVVGQTVCGTWGATTPEWEEIGRASCRER